MKYFLEMIDSFNRNGIAGDYGIPELEKFSTGLSQKGLNQTFLENVTQARPFVFEESNKGISEFVDNTSNTVKGSPFPIFTIETAGVRPMLGLQSTEDDGSKVEDYVYAILAIEKAPEKIISFALVKHEIEWVVIYTGIYLNSAIQRYIDRINLEKAGIELTNIKARIGRGKEKKFHKIRSVIHISAKPNHYVGAYGSREIDWTHRFEVRGHWRKKDGIGKDRSGSYCVEGFTWVTEHIRGPDELPLIKKQRVVHNDNSIRNIC